MLNFTDNPKEARDAIGIEVVEDGRGEIELIAEVE